MKLFNNNINKMINIIILNSFLYHKEVRIERLT